MRPFPAGYGKVLLCIISGLLEISMSLLTFSNRNHAF
jgi:hypothetical protein